MKTSFHLKKYYTTQNAMKPIIKLMTLSATMLLLHSCATVTPKISTTTTYHSTQRSATARTRTITEGSITETSSLVTDLVVEERKVSGSFSGRNVTEENAKQLAVADALKKADAEVLIEPTYEVEIRDNVDITAKVEGFPGRYKNFRHPTYSDSLMIGLITHYSDTTVTLISVPVGNTRSLSEATSTSVTQQTEVDLEKYRIDYMNNYNRYHRSGKKSLIRGSIFTLLGVSLIATSTITGSEGNTAAFIPMVVGGSLFFTLGIISIPIGISKLSKAAKLKREAPQHGIEIAFHPQVNPFTRTYTAGISMIF